MSPVTLAALPPFATADRPGSLRTVEVNGFRMTYWRGGTADGPPLLFLHGLGWDNTLWWPFVRSYLQRFDVICPDTRGHGRSDKPPGPYSIDLFAADMLALVDALALPRLAIVGLSQGGMTAQVMTARAPDRIAALAVLVAGARSDPTSAANMEERIAAQRQAGPEAAARIAAKAIFSDAFLDHTSGYLEAFVAWRAKADAAAMESAMRAINGYDVLPALPGFRLPALVIAGDRDRLIPSAATRAVAAGIPGARYVEIPDCGHMATIEQPTAVAAALDPFLEAYRTSR
jgi:pimeloyl-ACP methyl ester carboxylesterase